MIAEQIKNAREIWDFLSIFYTSVAFGQQTHTHTIKKRRQLSVNVMVTVANVSTTSNSDRIDMSTVSNPLNYLLPKSFFQKRSYAGLCVFVFTVVCPVRPVLG